MDVFGVKLNEMPAVTVSDQEEDSNRDSMNGAGPECISVVIHKLAEYFQNNDFKLLNDETQPKFFFATPHRSEIEMIEYHLAIGTNLSFID